MKGLDRLIKDQQSILLCPIEVRYHAKKTFLRNWTRKDTQSRIFQKNSQPISTDKVYIKSSSHHLLILRKENKVSWIFHKINIFLSGYRVQFWRPRTVPYERVALYITIKTWSFLGNSLVFFIRDFQDRFRHLVPWTKNFVHLIQCLRHFDKKCHYQHQCTISDKKKKNIQIDCWRNYFTCVYKTNTICIHKNVRLVFFRWWA